MRRLEYLDSAKQDFVNTLGYVTRESGSLAMGKRFVTVLRQKCRHLASLPGHLGRARPELRPDMRSFAFRGYVIFFRYSGNTLEVVNIIQSSRDIESYFEEDAQ